MHISFLQNPKLENPGKLFLNVPHTYRYLLALVILILCNLKFILYHIFCDAILVVDLVSLVVDLVVDFIAALVTNGLDGVIVVIGT